VNIQLVYDRRDSHNIHFIFLDAFSDEPTKPTLSCAIDHYRIDADDVTVWLRQKGPFDPARAKQALSGITPWITSNIKMAS
jgi:hypothetical protein